MTVEVYLQKLNCREMNRQTDNSSQSLPTMLENVE